MKLLPVAARTGDGPSPVGSGLRGVAIHWQEPGPSHTAEGQKFRPTEPELSWQVRVIPFRSLRADNQDAPPSTQVEQDRMVRLAYAIAAVHHPIAANATVYYEVGDWER